VAGRSKAWICGRKLAENAGSNPAVGRMFICCECCVLSGRCLCVGLITQPEESYRMFLSEYDREACVTRKPWPSRACCAIKNVSELICWSDNTNGPLSLPLLTVTRIGKETG
jgi:hypothetical protein